MKTNQNVRDYEVNLRERSNHKSGDDVSKTEPDPVTIMQFWYEEEDEISDFSLMQIAHGDSYEDNEYIS
jgi:hypothetical protein